MQRRLALVWHRFAYGHGHLLKKSMESTYMGNMPLARMHPSPPGTPLAPLTQFPVEQDALSTIMQWLYSKIPGTQHAQQQQQQ